MKKTNRRKVQEAVDTSQPPPTTFLNRQEPTTFGSFVRRHRVARGLSRLLLARQSGLEEGVLEKIELNLSCPSYQDIVAFAAVLDVPEEELIRIAGYVRRA